ncbi:hypothetical protein SDC9_211381 [bioreactor metagenome]|uniref:Uncharacterized protein n=1 Tax=bioreactor metagenome TaxID=1076179 RepID=A0A645JJS3_9ZZZZ
MGGGEQPALRLSAMGQPLAEHASVSEGGHALFRMIGVFGTDFGVEQHLNPQLVIVF